MNTSLTQTPIFSKLNRHLTQLMAGNLLSGSVLLLSMTVVNGGNYLFNLILGRWLGPAAFADLSLIVTLFLVVTLATATVQTVATKFSATYSAADNLPYIAGLRRWLGSWAWFTGGLLLLFFGLGAPLLQQFFHTASAWPFVVLGLGLPVYLAQGVDRGLLQGQTRFGLLSLSYQTEMWVRLAAALVLVGLGAAVNGAVTAITLSVVAAWVVARRVSIGLPYLAPLSRADQRQVAAFVGPAGAALVGQILINNSDILIVKHFFVAEQAGQYAALALIGRVVFFATWSVVAVMFPLVAQRHQKNESHRYLLFIALGLVTVVSLGIIGATTALPNLIVKTLFGPAYLNISPLLWLYATATMLYALANVVVHYWLSLGKSFGSILTVVAGVAQIGTLWYFHQTIEQVVLVQVGLMAVLLATLFVAASFAARSDNRC